VSALGTFVASLLIALGLSAGVLLLARARHRRLLVPALAMSALFALIWGLALAAISTDFHDSDGFVDCWPDCSWLQQIVSAATFGAPVLVLGLLIVAILSFTSRRRHGRAGDGSPGPGRNGS
jgi:hypothetical protein